LIAGATAGVMCTGADVFAQYVTAKFTDKPFLWDKRRTLGMGVFGMVWYGGPMKALYLMYDRVIGVGSLKQAALTACIDIFGHTWFFLVPCFYFITGIIRGKTPDAIQKQLKEEWWGGCKGMAAFWLPTCTVNFFFVPQHSRVLFICVCNFANKTWLSWYTNSFQRDEGDE